MSCLEVSVKRLGEGLTASVERLCKPIGLSVIDVTERLVCSVGIVCGIGNIKYLRVSPQEVQWITPDMGVVYTVESDTSWSIVIN